MIAAALQMLLVVLTSWLERREREAIAYLIEENRLLRRQLGGDGYVSPTAAGALGGAYGGGESDLGATCGSKAP